MTAALLATGAAESCTNPGTGTFTLLGPVSAVRRRFRDDSRISSGRQVWYCATDGTQSEWGVGTLAVGTNGASDTLTRDTITETTAGNTNKLNFTANLTVFSSDNAWSHPVKDATGVAWSGPNNDDRIKTEGTTLPGAAAVPDVNGFGSSATAVTTQNMTAVGKNLLVWMKGILSFADGYSAPTGEYGQATFTLSLANGTTTIGSTSDLAICTASSFGKVVAFEMFNTLTPGTTYQIVGSVQVTNSPDGAAKCKLSAINLCWFSF